MESENSQVTRAGKGTREGESHEVRREIEKKAVGTYVGLTGPINLCVIRNDSSNGLSDDE